MFPFGCYVFGSMKSEPSDIERSSGFYLEEFGDWTFFRNQINKILKSTGCDISISSSDDDFIDGNERLELLARAIDALLIELTEKPESWSIVVGHSPSRPDSLIKKIVGRDAVRNFSERLRIVVLEAARNGGGVNICSM